MAFLMGIINAMVTTIDGAGRIVVPKSIRDEGNLKPGTRVDIRLRDGVIEVEPVPTEVKLERRGRMLVAVPVDPTAMPAMSAATVEETRRSVRRSRGTD